MRGNWLCAAVLLGALTGQAGIQVGTYTQETRTFYTVADGLPDNDTLSVLATESGEIYAITAKGAAKFSGGKWVAVKSAPAVPPAAARDGLYVPDAKGVPQRVYPRDGARSWAPVEVRGVVHDAKGRLWFASPQGVGCRENGQWKLYTPADGLPYDDFTAVAAGGDGAVWFGTRRGAIRFDGKTWEYRQGLRWLPDDEVRSIAVANNGDAWFATAKGVGLIARKPATLREKAKFFEDEIDKRHRRTEYGYVLGVNLKRAGDLSEWTQHDSDNDGLWTAMYGAGECFAYAATKDPLAKQRAKMAFEALRFLQVVTQGGQLAPPRGYVARAILPTSGRNPNQKEYTREHDERMRATRDHLWKVLVPRWPTSANGKWYWKADTSSDELDGHYFLYALYYDLVAESPEEKQRVRDVVTALTDHLIDHNFTLVDWDGTPTRWGIYNPESLNQGPFWMERGLNSLSILSYLTVAEHVTGDAKYRKAADYLIKQHSYHTNVMVAKMHEGLGTGNHSDDEMAFMSYYNLLHYEKDSHLRQMYAISLARYWQDAKPEMNPVFNFIYAASCTGQIAVDAFDRLDLSPRGSWLEDSVDTLKRYPFDRLNWRHTNGYRKDIIPLPMFSAEPRGRRGHLLGVRRNGKAIPIDENFVDHWNHNPYELASGGAGDYVADGASFLLPYYMGLYHGYVVE